jgi:hypothetical protein
MINFTFIILLGVWFLPREPVICCFMQRSPGYFAKLLLILVVLVLSVSGSLVD